MAFWSKKPSTETPPLPEPKQEVLQQAMPEQPMPLPATNGAPATNMTPQRPAPQLSAEQLQQRANASANLLMKFGEVTSVLMRAPQFRNIPLAALETLVLPPLLNGQVLVAQGQSKSQGFVTPMAVALWASVSPEVDQRLSSNLDQPIQMAANEWRSGDMPWLIVLAGDNRVAAPLIKGLQQSLNGKTLKMRAQNKDGQPVVGTYTGEAPVAT
jgi:hemolysin-activating ACP:hemolysin acyltransferase